MTIDYTFPQRLCKRWKIEGLRLYLTGENLYTWSPMFRYTEMFDPEVITAGDSDFSNSQTSGLNGTGDGFSYPMLMTFTFGVNFTF